MASAEDEEAASKPIQMTQEVRDQHESYASNQPHGQRTATEHLPPRRRVRWDIVGGIAAVAAVPIALIVWLYPQPAGVSPGALYLEGVEMQRFEEVRFTPDETSRQLDGAEDTSEQETVIDFKLRNTGGEPILIESVDVEVELGRQLKNCDQGGGPFQASAAYDLRLPVDRPIEGESFNTQADFIVEPNSLDRFVLTVGPEEIGDFVFPWLYQLRMQLITDSGVVEAGNVALVSPASYLNTEYYGLYSATQDEVACLKENQDAIAQAASDEVILSAELVKLRDEHERMIRIYESEAFTSRVQWGEAGNRDWAAIQPVALCQQIELTTVPTLVAAADATGDGVSDYVVSTSCDTATGAAPDTVKFYDGASLDAGAVAEIVPETDGTSRNAVAVEEVRIAGGRIYVRSESLSDQLSGIFVIDVFDWTDGKLVRVFEQICSDGDLPRSCRV